MLVVKVLQLRIHTANIPWRLCTNLLEAGIHVPDQLVPRVVLLLERDVLHQRHAVRPEEHSHQRLECENDT